MFSVRKTAELSGLSQSKIYRMIHSGLITHRHLGKQQFIEHSEINHIILEESATARDSIVGCHPDCFYSLTESLNRGGVSHHVDGHSIRVILHNAIKYMNGFETEGMESEFIECLTSRGQ